MGVPDSDSVRFCDADNDGDSVVLSESGLTVTLWLNVPVAEYVRVSDAVIDKLTVAV